jgi:Zn-dependent protease with chaperone function
MAMNFFQHQEAARRSSRRLIVLFALAVIAIVVAVNAALAGVYFAVLARQGSWAQQGFSALPNYFFETTTAVVLLLIVGGTLQQILDLRAGGEAVGRMVGAVPVDPGTRDPAQRRLLNVIEEMALASGIPAPRAYLLEDEDGINAFAAGLQPSDAIVAVTRGTLARLNRDELQGVIGHEFSHILNGDMNLNLRLIGVLQGLLMLALFGRFLTSLGDTRDRRETAGSLLVIIGMAVLAIGYIGVFFGRLIKSSVSRQREFLADASSVQFTRNPDGIGGALRKIGGLGAETGGAVRHIHAETLSHLFIAPVGAAFADGLLASHPPLPERLRRIYGRPVEYLPSEETPREPLASEPALPPLDYAAPAAPATPLVSPLAAAAAAGPEIPAGNAGRAFALHESIGRPTAGTVRFGSNLPSQIDALGLRPALTGAEPAQQLVAAMLLDASAPVRARQLAAAARTLGSGSVPFIEEYARIVSTLPPGWRLTLLDLSMPALRTLAPAQREALLRMAHLLIQADGRITPAEFLLFSVLRRRLASVPAAPGPGRALRLVDVRDEAAAVMSLIACVRLPSDARRAFDAGRALLSACGPFRSQDDIALAGVSAAFDRLAMLAPLEKPLLVKACIAVAFIDGTLTWKASSCLRTLCAALDCPLPPQVEDAPV